MAIKNREKNQLLRILLTSALLFVAQHTIAMISTEETCVVEKEGISQNSVNNGLLIFLDDSESDTAKGASKVGVISHAFLCAFGQEAGPIVVSASVIANVREYKKPDERDLQKLVDRYISIEESVQLPDDATLAELKSIILSVLSFNEITVQPWIIKKINGALYLLLPKKYLQDKNISEDAVQEYISTDSVTSIEQQLGLKVNHMQTVLDIDEIKKTLPAPQAADYFIDALWDNERNTSNLFVTNNEYRNYNNSTIPLWSILITGHGIMAISIVGLFLQQFKNFLTFLEHRIHTKLLYYNSCYAAGINSKILYEDAEKGVDKIYPFAIITQTLTDTAIVGALVAPRIDQGVLKPLLRIRYLDCLKKVTTSDVINYHEVAALLTPPDYLKKFGIAGLAQIKFPGLPWFSVIDDDKVCSIGSILAKTRTTPLDMATFFAKQNKQAMPLGILLYVQDIPFELIVNTKTETGLPPVVISMIPGNAIHHIKKVSSVTNSVDDIVLSFLKIKHLIPQKIFIVDEVRGQNSDTNGITLNNVVIKLTPKENIVYYMQNDALFKMINTVVVEVGAGDREEYVRLLEICKPQKTVVVTAGQMTDLQTKVATIFAQQLTHEEAHKNIIHILDTMPNGAALIIPSIKGFSCPPNEQCWFDLVTKAQYVSFGVHKILWIGKIEICTLEACHVPLRDIIIDISKEETIVFFTTGGTMLRIGSKSGLTELTENYVLDIFPLFQYFNEHGQLPEQVLERKIPTTQELLTPEAIAKISNVQEEKHKKIQSRKNRRAKRCKSKKEM
jgi:hypothetical protein